MSKVKMLVGLGMLLSTGKGRTYDGSICGGYDGSFARGECIKQAADIQLVCSYGF
ncbi:MAG: hypothetical protein ACTTJ7_01160 [Treponema sp.]